MKKARQPRSKLIANRIAELEADLAVPPFPRELGYLWQTYLRLRRRKGGGMSGPGPIEWPDIDAFLTRSGVTLAPWEIEILERIDDIYLRPDPKPAAPEGQTVVAAASASDPRGVKSIIGAVGKRRGSTRKKEA